MKELSAKLEVGVAAARQKVGAKHLLEISYLESKCAHLHQALVDTQSECKVSSTLLPAPVETS